MDSNAELVDYLKRMDYMESGKVEDAFRKVDRADFVPEESRGDAYRDRPLQLAEGSTISAPHIVARITELAEVGEEDDALEIGSGSGYQLAVLSYLADNVTGIEPIHELVEKSRETLSDYENVEVFEGVAPEDLEDSYDRIIVSCGVDEDTWEKLKSEYLNEGGVMVGPVSVSGGAQRLRRFRDGEEEEYERVRFVRAK